MFVRVLYERNGSKVEKDKKRALIAAAAEELFSEFGYKSVSMDQIAQRANVAKGTLYLYFKDKDALLENLIQNLLTEIELRKNEILAKKISLVEQIHQLIYELLMVRKHQKLLYKLVQEAKDMRTPSACRMIQMYDNKITSYLKKQLDDAVEKGQIKATNTEVLAFVIFRVYTALAFEWEDTHDKPLNEKEVAQSTSMFLERSFVAI